MKTRAGLGMMASNIFFILPVIYAFSYHELLYLFFATGALIFSPLYHWFKITEPSSIYFKASDTLDFLFASGAFIYMYYYVFKYNAQAEKLIFYVLLSGLIGFYLLGKRLNYNRLHPWFHFFVPVVSSAILITSH